MSVVKQISAPTFDYKTKAVCRLVKVDRLPVLVFLLFFFLVGGGGGGGSASLLHEIDSVMLLAACL